VMRLSLSKDRTAYAAALTLVAAFAFGANPARAGGTATIAQIDGSIEKYDSVSVAIIHKNLFVTTHDGKGTLVIQRAACAYQGELMVCFPTAVTLVQASASKPLDLRSGTIYLNLTDSAQPLALSTTKVPAQSVLLSFTTKRGTYVSVSGRIDRVVK
jgi:hypothetical protein